jgi:hypothetical protein
VGLLGRDRGDGLELLAPAKDLLYLSVLWTCLQIGEKSAQANQKEAFLMNGLLFPDIVREAMADELRGNHFAFIKG